MIHFLGPIDLDIDAKMPYYNEMPKLNRLAERQKDYQAAYLKKHDKVRTTVYLSRPVHKEARLEAIRRDIGLSQWIEELLAAELGFSEFGNADEQTGDE